MTLAELMQLSGGGGRARVVGQDFPTGIGGAGGWQDLMRRSAPGGGRRQLPDGTWIDAAAHPGGDQRQLPDGTWIGTPAPRVRVVGQSGPAQGPWAGYAQERAQNPSLSSFYSMLNSPGMWGGMQNAVARRNAPQPLGGGLGALLGGMANPAPYWSQR